MTQRTGASLAGMTSVELTGYKYSGPKFSRCTN